MDEGELVPLNMLLRGQCALIEQLVGQAELVHRLEELGLRVGIPIEMLQPGSPCIVRVADQKLCFRDADLFSVIVRPGVTSCHKS
ncbi:MAG TPA: FeoA family protein [Pirellulaceae bacterium]|nr:FeoA family protein [Pirellulaceae bacterium]